MASTGVTTTSAQDLSMDSFMHQQLFHLGQTPPPQTAELMDPLDPSSCLSLMHSTASNTTTPSAATSPMFDKQQQQQWQQYTTNILLQQHQQQHPLDYTTQHNHHHQQQQTQQQHQEQHSSMFLPPTPPVESPAQAMQNGQIPPWFGIQFNGAVAAAAAAAASGVPGGIPSEPSPPPSSNLDFGMPSLCYLPQQHQHQQPIQQQVPPPSQPQQQSNTTTTNNNNNNNHTGAPTKSGRGRRRSSPSTRPYRRRNSSHPSVASVVSLSAHEPVAHFIDGIEHITFLYSHDRLVKEYTVRTDVDSCMLEEIPMEFRVLNAIYPRANVEKEDYDGNRWEYETSCNQLGWKLCWLNQDQLCGRRGLIQRAVDSYRNRHVNMRSRRVTRQEKVANGTLRRRRAKRS
ncbi:hypothetical protein BDC45DRAFT_517158 [Circinella umbellata]|nr:hypothetical protein BDC45DRAFT_517158 [Circinella umbellata]